MHGTADDRGRSRIARATRPTCWPRLTGLIGTGFHLYNVGKRPGGFCWQNLFYGAPLGAPMAILLSGLLGFCSERVRDNAPGTDPRSSACPPAGRWRRSSAPGLLGTAARPGLLHFRGAYHNPVMFLPVTRAAGRRAFCSPVAQRPVVHAASIACTRWWLRLTGAHRLRRRRLPRLRRVAATWAAGATGARTC